MKNRFTNKHKGHYSNKKKRRNIWGDKVNKIKSSKWKKRPLDENGEVVWD